MFCRAHPRAATILSSLVLVASLSAGTAIASTQSQFSPPPPPDEAPAPVAPQMQVQQSPMDQFRQTLQQHGSFHTHPLYGEVWKPSQQNAPPGWSPYPACHWQFDREQRTWVFNDPTEWGAVVHRHGRWANDPQHGWVWVADANFGPGWVFWRTEAQQVSWAPMLPEQHGNQPPRDGWQSQDQATFNSGCRQSQPPAPTAGYGPPRGGAPMPMTGGPGYSSGVVTGGGGGGGIVTGGGPIFVPGRPPIFVPGRPPILGGLPPGCSLGIRPSWCRPICATRPFLPGCRGPVGGMARPFPQRPFLHHGHWHHRHVHHRHWHHRHFHHRHVHRPFHHHRFVGRHGGHRVFMGHRGGHRGFIGHRGGGGRGFMGHRGGARFARR
jgi:hypothetical protein